MESIRMAHLGGVAQAGRSQVGFHGLEGSAIPLYKEALTVFENEEIDLILLDVMLPKIDGFQVCRKIRVKSNIPIIMLTAKEEEVDKVLGLELGADDYITKPFSNRELLARIKAIMRREPEIKNDIEECAFGSIYINFKTMEATKNKKPIDLSNMEFKGLKYLCQRQNIVINRDTLLDEVWGYDNYPSTRTVDNFILSLRKKIEDDPSKPEFLITMHGAGYKLIKEKE